MKTGAKGRIFKISRFSTHDGPGIRTTVFLKGCPGRCLWCCNPESQLHDLEIMWRGRLCVSCGSCLEACSHAAIRGDGPRVVGVDGIRCAFCGGCAEVCPSGAIEISGRDYDAEELFTAVERDEPFWRRSGGGVTLSGGEVLAQPDFAMEFLSLCKRHHVHTSIETCLFASFDTIRCVSDLTDFIQFDIKAFSPDLHKALTSLDNRGVIENAKRLLRSSDRQILVRFPLLPGLNDDPQEVRRIGRFLGENRDGVDLEILPYHDMGAEKYAALGRVYPIPSAKPPTELELVRAASILGEFPINVKMTARSEKI